MWGILSVILFLLLALYFSKYFFLKKEIQQIAQTIPTIDPIKSNQQLRISTQNIDIIHLTTQINNLYSQISKDKTQNIIDIKEVQQSMANISHDLRTPLTSIVGYLDLLSAGICTEKERQEYIEICKRKSHSLQALVQNLFELSRLENHEYPFELETVDAGAILQQELANNYDSFISAEILPSISIPNHPLTIINDPKALARIFANLLNNIVKHSNKQNVSIAAKQTEDTIFFIFANSAPNLSQNDIDKLFARFFISDKMRSNENTGIGLSIVKEFVEQTGGIIYTQKENDILQIILQWKAAP